MSEAMLCRAAREIPHGRVWRHEPKWDGFRAIAARTGSGVTIRSRRGADLGARFPEVAAALAEALAPGTSLDGELVAVGSAGLEFGALCRRLSGADAPVETLYVAFDLLELGGRDCRSLPLRQRRALLMEAIGTHGRAASAAVADLVAGRRAEGALGRLVATPRPTRAPRRSGGGPACGRRVSRASSPSAPPTPTARVRAAG